MRLIAWVVIGMLLAAIPTVRAEKKPPPFPGAPEVDPMLQAGNYKAPKADGAVVVLFDEGMDPMFPQLTNDGGGEAGTITREDRDVFAGVEAVRVTPMQKYASRLPEWNFKIVETPKNAGEFRYLRFAWKKFGGTGLMIQFHDPEKSWAFRYHAGRNVYGWNPSLQVSAAIPGEWEVVTRDLFKDYGAFTISGFALTPLDGTAGLFDHMLLGRSIEDLDKATDAALGRNKPAKAIAGAERDQLWKELLGTDRDKAAAALRTFLSTAPDNTAFIEEQLGKTSIDKQQLVKIQKLLKDLDEDDYDVRDRATDELVKLGAEAVDAVKALAASPPNDEVAYRSRLILRRMNKVGEVVSGAGRMARVVRILERAENEKSRALLSKLAEGEYGFEIVPDAKAALARIAKKK